MGAPPIQPTGPASGRSAVVRGAAGAVIGALLGYWLYFVLLRRGIVVLPLPGAAIGICRDLATRQRSWPLAALCGLLAAGVQGYIVQTRFPGGFVELRPIFWAAFIAGIVFAVWFGLGRTQPAPKKDED